MVSLCNKQDIITYQIKASTVLDFERNAIVYDAGSAAPEIIHNAIGILVPAVGSINEEYIFAIGNKLVYNDGKFGNPYTSKVVTINLTDETDIDSVRQVIFKYEEGGLYK